MIAPLCRECRLIVLPVIAWTWAAGVALAQASDQRSMTPPSLAIVNARVPVGDVVYVTDATGNTVKGTLAARLWPGEDRLGRQFRSSSDLDAPLEVIGIVQDARYRRDEIGGPAVPRYFASLDQFNGVARTLHVRSRTATARMLASGVIETVRRLDSAVPVYDVYTLERQINDSGGAHEPALS